MEGFKIETESLEAKEGPLERAKKALVEKGIELSMKQMRELLNDDKERQETWENRLSFPKKWLEPHFKGRSDKTGEEGLAMSIVLSQEAINAERKEKEEIFKALKEHDFQQIDFSVKETNELITDIEQNNPEAAKALETYWGHVSYTGYR